jgi:hypothetical protein
MLRTFLVLMLVAAATPAHAQLAGDWRGVGLQVDRYGAQSSWTIAMRVQAEGVNRIEYPSLGCKATLHEVRRQAAEIEFREEITQGDCIDGGRLIIRPMDGRLWWYWHDAEGRANACAVLYRKEDPIG